MDFESLFPTLSTLRPSEQVVLIQLHRHKLNDESYASQGSLILWTGIKSTNTIKTAIKELIHRGFVKCLKPGRQNSPALYRLCLPGKDRSPGPAMPETSPLNSDNRLRLAAIKRAFSPATWQAVKRESKIAGITEDTYLIQKYFGPERIRG